MKKFTLVIIIISLAGSLYAQSNETNTWSVGAHFGPTYFCGDLSENALNDSNFTAGFGYGLNVTKNFTHTFGLQAQFAFGTLNGNKAVGDNYFAYEGKIKYEVSLRGVVNFSDIFSKKKESKFLVYAAAGIGWGGYDAKFKVNAADWVEVNDNMATLIPLALGAKYKLSKRLDLHLEYGYRFTNSDMIDGVRENLSSIGVTNPLITSENNDSYSYLNTGLTYHFGKGSQGIEWVAP